MPCAAAQDLWYQGSSRPTIKGRPPGNCSLHCRRDIQLLQPQIQRHRRPGNNWLLLMPPVLRIHKVHRPPPDGPILAPRGLCVLFQGLYPPWGRPCQAFCYATQICITLDNQNNSIRSETVSHFWSEFAAAYPVKAGTNIFLHLRDRGCNPTTPISNFPPITDSAPSAYPKSSPSSVPRPIKWGRPDLDSPQKMSERAISALAEP